MKSYLFVCFLAAAIVAAQGYTTQTFEDMYNEEALEAMEGTRNEPVPHFEERFIDAPFVQEDGGSQNESCDCDTECDKLHVSRLPHDVRVSPCVLKVL